MSVQLSLVKEAIACMHHPRKLRLGYIWANYQEQVIETLISSIFQYHNRSKFEIYGYCLVDADDEFTCSDVIGRCCSMHSQR
ncbi:MULTISPECIES: hypothetical protein [unclassified Calothrix]|uniref:hypothetical protein n=1 Tax=unclassified Calothrix TaxID=2619626 RepID=UPI0030DBF113